VTLATGVVGISNFFRTSTGAQVSFNAAPRAVQITDSAIVTAGTFGSTVNGTDTVSGNINYNFSQGMLGTSTLLVDNHNHSGQLDFSRFGKTDQYRNLAIHLTEATGAQVPRFVMTISNLEIVTPRVSVSRLIVTTPTPVAATPPSAPADGSLMVVSDKDGSRVQYDYVSPTSVRLRAWNSGGILILDVTKSRADADVVAAANTAAN
jgi:hypothetical protein